MKKYFILTLIAALSLAACTKENAPQGEVAGNQAQNEYNFIFSATIPVPPAVMNDGTKTTVSDAGVVSWEGDETLDVWYLDGEGQPKKKVGRTLTPGTSTSICISLDEGDAPDHFWAAYPEGSSTLTNEGSESFSITVSATDGSFKGANFMTAYTTSSAASFVFKHAVGIIRLALPEDGVISHAGTDYTIRTIRLKGKETSIYSMGTATVNISGDAVSGYTYPTSGTQSVAVNLTDAVRTSGYAYIASFPGTLTNGFAIRYYSDEGPIPAALTVDTPVAINRSSIRPISDISPRIVWDYYVAADGNGDGLSDADPMSLTQLQSILDNAGSYMCYANLLNGTTVHFASGTYTLASSFSFPAFTEVTNILMEGNGAVLDGDGAVRVLSLAGNNKKLIFKDFSFKNGLAAAKGAGIYAAPGNGATDNSFVIDFENCLISSNAVTSGYGAGLTVDAPGTASASSAGQLRFNNCRFENNVVSSGQAGAVYLVPNCGAAALFNKCTFMGNTATNNTYTIGVNCNGSADTNHGRLAMNNCTVNTGNKVFTSNGSSLTLKGYSVIVNSTIWGSGETGKWGTLALGANNVAQSLDANAASVINCIIRNNSSNYKGLYLHGSYYQNIKHCLYTGLTEAGNATAEGANPTYTLSNSASISTTVAGAAAKTKVIDGITAYYYTFTQDYSSDITFPSLEQVRAAINNTTGIGPLFLSWLDTLDDALTTDLIGQARSASASHPGSWQKQ